MKLTNYLRESFVNAVMNDVPQITISKEEVQALVLKAMPPKVKAIYKDEALRKHLKTTHIFIGNASHYGIVIGDVSEKEVFKELLEKVQARRDMRTKLYALAKGCSTVKQLQEAAPLLTKYMPSDDPQKTPNLPMVVNVMGDLRALGFKPS